jgi:hypothetical protein
MFPHRNIHKYNWTSDQKMHEQIYHVLIDKRQHSYVVDVQYFRGTDRDNDHNLVLPKEAEGWRKTNIEGLPNLYTSPNIIKENEMGGSRSTHGTLYVGGRIKLE